MKKKDQFDICIIGAGIVGLAHAYHAATTGLRVIVLERNQFSLGASVRNFGLIWPIGQKEATVGRAYSSRETWLSLADQGILKAKENGSLHLAYHDDEMAVLEEFFLSRPADMYDATLMTTDQLVSQYPHIKREGLKGGMLSNTELTVDPREAIQNLTEYLSSLPNVEFRFGRAVTEVNMPEISTFDETIHAQKVIICSGADFETLYPNELHEAGLRKCKLQMMRTAPIVGFKLGPTLCAGLTLRHYAAFADCPSLPKLSQRYDESNPEFREHGIHVLLAQNHLGELVIGDSHEYEYDFHPFNQEKIDNHILDYLDTFFSVDQIQIAERWHGIYSCAPSGTELLLKIEEDVLAVNGLGGAGMTLSFGLAKEVIDSMHINAAMSVV